MFLPAIEPLHLRPIPAAGHVTPAPVMVLARVQEKPLAGFGEACPHIRQLVRRQQIRRRTGNGPQHAIKIAEIVKAPFEVAALHRNQLHVPCRILHVGIEARERARRRRPFIDDRPKNIMNHFAQFSCPEQSLVRTFRIQIAPLVKPVHLRRIKQPDIFGEPCEIAIRLQQFLGLDVTVVERVDEVETYVPRNQIEVGQTASRDFFGLGQRAFLPDLLSNH